jgi:hypothetical protein
MENLAKQLARDSKIPRRRPRAKASKLSTTILMVGGAGDVLSFSMTKLLVVAVIACLTTIAFVVFSLFSYHAILKENRGLKDELNQVKLKLVTAQGDKEKAFRRLMILEAESRLDKKKNDYASIQNPAARISQVAKPYAPRSENTTEAIAKTLDPVGKGSEARTREVSDPVKSVFAKSVAVEKFEIWQAEQGDSLKFRFTLKNIDQRHRKVKGYTFVVLKPETGSQEPVIAYPQTPMKDGKPAVFDKGEYFSIARFKPVFGSFSGIEAVGHFKTATVYIYSNNGSILVEKVYEVDKVFRF